MPPDDQNRTAKSFGQGYAYVGVGFSFAAAILAFGALGWLLDGWLGTRPLFAIAGAFLGGFGGFMSIYYRVKRDTEAERREREARGARGEREERGER